MKHLDMTRVTIEETCEGEIGYNIQRLDAYLEIECEQHGEHRAEYVIVPKEAADASSFWHVCQQGLIEDMVSHESPDIFKIHAL